MFENQVGGLTGLGSAWIQKELGAKRLHGSWTNPGVLGRVATGWVHLGFDLLFSLALCFNSFFVVTIMD